MHYLTLSLSDCLDGGDEINCGDRSLKIIFLNEVDLIFQIGVGFPQYHMQTWGVHVQGETILCGENLGL